MTLLAQLRSFKFLAFTSVLGDVAVLGGLAGTIYFGFQEGNAVLPPSKLPGDGIHMDSIPQAAGNIAFLFLIHVVILPISQSMRLGRAPASSLSVNMPLVTATDSVVGRAAAPDNHVTELVQGFGPVAISSYAIITVINASFAGVCYCMFGEDTQPNVLQNLQSGSAGVLIIQILLCVDLLFTIPMILAAGRELCEGYAMATAFGGAHENLTRTLVRLLLVALIFAIAAGISSFGEAVSLIGGLANSIMGLMLPPLLYSSKKLSPVHVITLLGALLLVTSTFFNIKGMLT